MRGHGMTNTLNHVPGDKATGTIAHGKEDENLQLSIDQLCEDFAFILTRFMQWFNRHSGGSKRKVHFYLVGHSLGGAVLTKVLYEQDKQIKKRLSDEIFQNVKGLVIIDIVEETAVKALGSMNSYLRSVPPQFASLQSAIDWHVKTGLIHNRKSAEISIPVMFTPSKKRAGFYEWVLDLSKTERYWKDWFTGLSYNFVNITSRVSKMLILSNNDYLDKDLMIGQMQDDSNWSFYS
ncbi:unnamed protein product [Ambrosiozyma monospora]|uniref:Unnamed protein product n=1 Tax=Ambrosiozyma monospora TaxID=43982 RepID=A0ACB5U3F7_AMBMO|nr:unnamed protein product [Ambrosiozyma monospora]